MAASDGGNLLAGSATEPDVGGDCMVVGIGGASAFLHPDRIATAAKAAINRALEIDLTTSMMETCRIIVVRPAKDVSGLPHIIFTAVARDKIKNACLLGNRWQVTGIDHVKKRQRPIRIVDSRYPVRLCWRHIRRAHIHRFTLMKGFDEIA
jgi:hypothetical protein